MLFVWTAISGWMATVLLCVGVGIPYYVRSNGVAARARLRAHYWMGFLIPAAAFLHAWIPMSSGRIRGLDPTGLLLATAALLIMLVQVSLGVRLRSSTGADYRKVRRVHFWTMASIAALIAAHITLNRA